MKITEIEVLHLQIETSKPIQDATIPTPTSEKGTRAQIFVNIYLSLIHIRRCRRAIKCRSRWSTNH